MNEVRTMNEAIPLYVIADCKEENLHKTIIEYIKKLMFEIPKYPFKTDCTVIRIFDAKSKAETVQKGVENFVKKKASPPYSLSDKGRYVDPLSDREKIIYKVEVDTAPTVSQFSKLFF